MTDLLEAMKSRGLNPPADLPPGKISRFSSNGKSSDKAGWCLLFPDGEGAVFGDHRAGWQATWQAKRSEPMTPAQKKAWRKKIVEARTQVEAERDAEHQAAAQRARREWESARPVDPQHRYLASKRVKPYGARQNERGQLLIPVLDAKGAIQSVQRISPDGSKQFLSGGKMAGGRYWLREPKRGAEILLGEGFATMASVAEAMPDAGVVMAFSAGNLKEVAESVRKQHSKTKIIVCGDRDESGTGQTKATEAAEAASASVVLPPHTGDFNDLHVGEGLDAVRAIIQAAPQPLERLELRLDEGAWPAAIDKTLTHLASARTIFDFGSALVAIDGEGGTFPITPPWLCTAIERRFRVTKYNKTADDYLPARVPMEFAQRLLSQRESWTFPRLQAVIQHRVLRDDGSVLDRAGLDRKTGIYLHAKAAKWKQITSDLREAVKTLWHPVSQMPYESQADAGAALALLLTAVQRPALELAPMFLIGSPTYGTGKTLLGIVAALLAGADGSVTVMGERQEEKEKAILAALLGGRRAILLDNLSGSVGGDHLAAALTSPAYRGRILGQSAEVMAPTRTLWVGTGINIYPSADLVRRSLTIRLDAKTERPELRQFDIDPVSWTREHLAEMQAAALAILKAGRQITKEKLGSFGQWDTQVRQAVLTIIEDGLAPCDMTDPLETMARERESDPEVERLSTLLNAWHSFMADRPVAVVDLVAKAKAASEEALLGVLDEVAGDGRGNINARKLGWYLRRHEGRIVSGLTLKQAVKGRFGIPWRVVPVTFSTFETFSPATRVNSENRDNTFYQEWTKNKSQNSQKSQPCPACDGEGCAWCREATL
ncbi:toprim domain-containing protein [Acidithiobacillus caldus]